MGNGNVQIAYLHGHDVSHSWHESMLRLVAYDAANEGRTIETGGPFMIRADSGGLVEARNLAVARFLDETPHEWLWFVDTDMGFHPDIVDRLVSVADPVARPVVGALCFALRETRPDGMGGRRVMAVPTLFRFARTASGHVGFTNRFDFPAESLVEVAATGAACLLIHRTALEKVRAEYGDRWFDPVRYGDGRPVSEDLSFCWRLHKLGVLVHVHTGIKTTHHKRFWLSDLDYNPPAEFLSRMRAGVDELPEGAEPSEVAVEVIDG